MTHSPFSILIVEDESDFRDALCRILRLEGFSATGVSSIAEYRVHCAATRYDVLVIDRRLPDGDGLDLIRQHRATSAVPVIVLTAKGQLADRVAGIEADADHYLVKPVATEELLALLRQMQRRARGSTPLTWVIDAVGWYLQSPAGIKIALTRREVLFLGQLVDRPGQAVTRQTFISALGESPGTYDPRRMEIMVRRLRHKVEEAGGMEFPLTTVYGVGYAFNGRLEKT